MNVKRENAVMVGAGAAACAVCCAGPILGFLAAIGLGTAAGVAVFGTVSLIVGGGLAAFVLVRRRRRAAACDPPSLAPVPVEFIRGPEQS